MSRLANLTRLGEMTIAHGARETRGGKLAMPLYGCANDLRLQPKSHRKRPGAHSVHSAPWLPPHLAG